MAEVLYNGRRNRPCVYFQQGKCNRPQCSFAHELVAPAMVFSSAPSDSSSSQNTSLNTPATRSQAAIDNSASLVPLIRHSAYRTRPCRFYAKGRCTAGDACRWSHDESLLDQEDPMEEELDEECPNGYKLVPKSYRTQPCARFNAGHCYYGDECNFIHSTTPQTSNPGTPLIPPPQSKPAGPSPPHLAMKSHSTQHSPAISSLHAPAIRSSISAATPPPSNIGATLSAPTRPRELPPPVSQSHLSGIDWSVPTPSTPGIAGTSTPPLFASSPLITAAQTLSRSNSVGVPTQEPKSSLPNLNSNLPSQMRSPFLFTFGEIGPGSAMNSPRGLGLNGANLAPVGTTSASASPRLVPSRLATAPTAARIGSPGLSASALGTTGINMVRQKSRLSTSTDLYPDHDDHLHDNTDAETEPDFPSISYSTLGDLVTEPDEDLEGPLARDPDFNALAIGSALSRTDYLNNDSVTYGDSQSGVNGQYHDGIGISGYGLTNGNNTYESDWGIALSALQNEPQRHSYGGQPSNGLYQPNGYKMRPCKFYVAGSRCPAGQNCTFIHDPEALRRSSISAYPPPNSIPPEMHPLYRTRECKYHLAGQCHQGETCAFKHTGPPGQGREYENWEGFSIQVNERETAEDRSVYRSRPCRWFLKGNCFHGDKCTYSHSAALLARPACIFFRNGTGHCINGDDCRFSHDIYEEDDLQTDADQQSDIARDNEQHIYPGVPERQLPVHIPPVLSTTFTDDEDTTEQRHYSEPYFGGVNGLVNGMDSLTVGPRMELVVSEGEDEDEEDDIVVLRRSFPKAGDPTSQDVEQLFANSPI